MADLTLDDLGLKPSPKKAPAIKPTPLLADGLGDNTEAEPTFDDRDALAESLRQEALGFGVDPSLVVGQATAESSLREGLEGDKDLGLNSAKSPLQVRPVAVNETNRVNKTDFDPNDTDQRRQAGIAHLGDISKDLSSKGFQGEDLLDLSAATFNAGQTRVNRDIEKARKKFNTPNPTFDQVAPFLPESTRKNVVNSRAGRKEDQVRQLKRGKVTAPESVAPGEEQPAFQLPTMENTLNNLKTLGGIAEVVIEDFLIRFPIEGTAGTINGIIEAVREGDINAFPKGFEASQGTLPLPESEAGNKVREVFGEGFDAAFKSIDDLTESQFDVEKDPEAAAAFNVGLKSLLFLAPVKGLGKKGKTAAGESGPRGEPEFQFSEQAQKIDNIINLAEVSDNPFEVQTALRTAEKELNARQGEISPEEFQKLSDRLQGLRDNSPAGETPADKSARGETLSLAEVNEATAPRQKPATKKSPAADLFFKENQKIEAQAKESELKPQIKPKGQKDPRSEIKAPEIPQKAPEPIVKETKAKIIPTRAGVVAVPIKEEPSPKQDFAPATLTQKKEVDKNPDKALSEDILERIGSDKPIKNNVDLKNLVGEKLGKKRSEVTNEELKGAQEATEFAHVLKAREIVADARQTAQDLEILTPDERKATFDKLVKLHEGQPVLTARSSTSVANQAFSTPLPISFLASELARIGSESSVLEPTAGHGALLIGAKGNVTANEINPGRLESLKKQGFKTSNTRAEDPTKPLAPPKSQEAVIVNPPFGGLPEPVSFEGFKISRLDHQIAAESLKAMKDDGRAVLIVGGELGKGKKPEAVRVFENYLFSRFNVADQFQIAGKLYNRQGAAFPIKVYVVAGRQASKSFAPTEIADEVSTFGELHDRFKESLKKSENIRSDESGGATVPELGDTATAGAEGPSELVTLSGTPAGSSAGLIGGRKPRGSEGGVGRPGTGGGRDVGKDKGGVDRPSDAGELLPGSVPGGGRIPNLTDTAPVTGTSAEALARGAEHLRDILEPEPVKAPEVERVSVEALQEPYTSIKVKGRSEGFSPKVLLPTNQVAPVAKNLARLVEKYGPLDEFVMKELGYKNKKELHKALFGIQIDSLAGAIDNAKAGKGFIVGDQTGIGKGRQAAAMIKWSKRQGWVPVFITGKGDLFSAMARDLRDIGEQNRPFVFNQSPQSRILDNQTGEIIQANLKPSELKAGLEELAGGRLPEGFDSMFLTYSQYQNLEKSQTKIQAIKGIAPKAYFVLDESHNAGGAGQSGGRSKKGEEGSNIFRVTVAALDQARGVTYLSATYSKRPDTMPLYKQTDLGEAFGGSMDDLIGASVAGGTPFQNLVSAALAEKGQLVRRETSAESKTISFLTVDETKPKGREQKATQERVSDVATEGMRAIDNFSNWFTGHELKAITKRFQAEGSMPQNTPDFKARLNATNFSSRVHNFIKQLLLGLKTDQVVSSAIGHLKAGRKPVIVVENTMETFVTDFMRENKIGLNNSLGDFNWGIVLSKSLDSLMSVSTKTAQGERKQIKIKPSDLSVMGQDLLKRTREELKALNFENPVSPIDQIKQEIQAAGFSIGEMSGRKVFVDYSGENPVARARTKKEMNKAQVRIDFQNGGIDALVLNASAKEGIDLHSDKAVKDHSQRAMIVAQPNSDINVFMQILGRVDRTNQVNTPIYEVVSTAIPAEIRPAAILQGKLAKLSANTNSNSKSAFSLDTIDLYNEIGNEVVAKYLEEDQILQDEIDITPPTEEMPGNFAAKVTGRLALLPVTRQRAIWGDLTAQYNDTIDYLKSIGENPLETDFIDLQAEVIEGTEKILHKGQDQNNPFDADAKISKFTVKKQSNPMTPAVIKAEIFEKGQEKTSALLEQKGRSIQKDLADIAEKSNREPIDPQRVNETIRNWKRYAIGTGFNLRIQDTAVEAVVLDIQISNFNALNGNVFAPSRTKIVFAVNQGVGRFSASLSRLRPGEGSSDISPEEGMIHEPDIDEMFSGANLGNPREERFIMTGNLIRGFSEARNKGRIVDFSTVSGDRQQGILMPKGFDPASDVRNEPPMLSPDSIMEFHKNADPIRNKVGVRAADTGLADTLEITPTESGGIKISVPATKSEGGKYFLNPDLVAITGDFFGTRGGRMSVEVPEPKSRQALAEILKKDKLYSQGQPQVTKIGNKDALGGVTFNSGIDPTQIVKLFENTTGKLFDAAANSKLQYFAPLRDLPQQREYLETRALGFGETARIGEIGRKLFDTFSKGIGKNRNLSQEVYDYLTTKEAIADSISDPEMRELAVTAKGLIRTVGRKLVAKGIMTQEIFDKHDDEYLPIVYLRHLLNLDKKSFTSTGAGFKVGDLGYLKQRNPKIPEDVKRFVLGEIKDPAFLLARGFTQPMKDMAILEVLESISQNPNWVLPQSMVEWQGKKVSAIWLKKESEYIAKQSLFMSNAEDASIAQGISKEMAEVSLPALDFRNVAGHKQVPDSPRYGRLRGMWVREEIFDDLIGTTKMITGDESFWERMVGTGGHLSKVTALWKISKVALNPPTQIRNLVSNMVLMHLSGVPMMRIPDLMIRAIGQIVQGEIKGNLEKSKVWQEAKLRGINATTFNHQEMLQIQEDYLALKVREEEGFGGVYAWMKNVALKGVLKNASNIYGLSEAVGKTAKMIHEIETNGAHPADAYAEAQKWLFDYSLVPPSVRTARTTPLGAPFLTFQYKVLPRLAEVASKTPWRLLPYLAIPYILAQVIASTYEVEPEDVDDLKEALPFWFKKNNAAIMPYKDEHNRWQVLDYGYFLPWGQFQELFDDAINLDFSDSLKTTGILGGPVPNITAAITTNIDPFTKREIVTPGATPSQQVGEIVNYTWRLGAPTWLTDIGAANHMRKSLEGTVNPKTGEPLLTKSQAALRFLGANVYPIDPELSRGQNIRRMKFEISQTKRAMSKQLRNANLTNEQADRIEKDYLEYIEQLHNRLDDYIAGFNLNPKLLGPPPKKRK